MASKLEQEYKLSRRNVRRTEERAAAVNPSVVRRVRQRIGLICKENVLTKAPHSIDFVSRLREKTTQMFRATLHNTSLAASCTLKAPRPTALGPNGEICHPSIAEKKGKETAFMEQSQLV